MLHSFTMPEGNDPHGPQGNDPYKHISYVEPRDLIPAAPPLKGVAPAVRGSRLLFPPIRVGQGRADAQPRAGLGAQLAQMGHEENFSAATEGPSGELRVRGSHSDAFTTPPEMVGETLEPTHQEQAPRSGNHNPLRVGAGVTSMFARTPRNQ